MSDAILERSLAKTAANLQGLEMAGLTLDEIDLVEVNEAFAAQVIAVMRELELDGGRLNVNEGAIALGHPTGMSGARLPLEFLYSLKERGERYGLAAICGNGGNGAAMVPRDRAVAPLSRHPRGSIFTTPLLHNSSTNRWRLGSPQQL